MRVQYIGDAVAVVERGGRWVSGEVREVSADLAEHLLTNPLFIQAEAVVKMAKAKVLKRKEPVNPAPTASVDTVESKTTA